jgi:hypothetical protein
MLSKLPRSIGLFTMSIVLCLSLPRVQASPPTAQLLVYFPIVQQPPVLVLSEPVGYTPSQYSYLVIGDVINVSTTQAFFVTLQAIVYYPSTGITETQTFTPDFPVIFPGQGSPFVVASDPCGCSRPVVLSLSLYQVVPVSASTLRPLTVIPKGIACYISSYGYITGSVRNDNTAAITVTSIVAWSLRSDSSRGLGSAFIAEAALAPGAEQAFSTGLFPSLCIDGRPAPDLSLDWFQYAAQGTVIP